MNGKRARLVVMNKEDLVHGQYSFAVFEQWSIEMKLAIGLDLQDEKWDPDNRAEESVWRYKIACESVIAHLLFDLKWARIGLKNSADDNKG